MKRRQWNTNSLLVWETRIVSLIITLALWGYVQFAATPREQEITVPVQYEDLPSNWVVTSDAAAVRVSIRRNQLFDKSKVWTNLIVPYINLAYAHPGMDSYVVGLKPIPSLDRDTRIQLLDSTVTIRIDRLETEVLPIVARLRGTPAKNFVVHQISLSTSNVAIQGPSEVMQKISRVYTERISVSRKDSSFTETASLRIPNNVTLLSGVSNIQVQVSMRSNTKINQPVQIPANVVIEDAPSNAAPTNQTDNSFWASILNSQANLESEDVESTIQVQGLPPYLHIQDAPSFPVRVAGDTASLSNKDARVLLSASGAPITSPGNYQLPVSVSVPTNIQVMDAPSSVSVQIAFAEGWSQMLLPLQIQNLPAGFRVSNVSIPVYVQTAQTNQTNALVDQLQVQADLSPITEAGPYAAPVEVTYPPDAAILDLYYQTPYQIQIFAEP